MKKITTIFTILCLLQSCYSQKHLSTYIDYDKDFFLLNNEKFSGKDTLIVKYGKNGEIIGKGNYALDQSGNVSSLKIGNWTYFYSNGSVKATGEYQISSYIDCGTAGLERIFYNYKIGDWIYFYQDSTIEAKGLYYLIKTKIDTRCEGGDSLIFMIVTDNWLFNNLNNESIDKLKYLTISTKFDDGFKIDYSYDFKADKVLTKFGNE
jgi:hypothetical protein